MEKCSVYILHDKGVSLLVVERLELKNTGLEFEPVQEKNFE